MDDSDVRIRLSLDGEVHCATTFRLDHYLFCRLGNNVGNLALPVTTLSKYN